jgi:tetratricopeptide (TPR) repeat protein
MGKSALAWHWLHNDMLGSNPPLDGLFWWSFYESGATFDNFVRNALLYFGGDPASAVRESRPWRELVTILRRLRVLLVLDGVERCLRAYGRVDSAYQGDDIGQSVTTRARECVSPEMQRFLVALLTPGNRTKTLITTRLCPAELDDREGCYRHDLGPMSPAEAVEYFRFKGIRPDTTTDAEVKFACEHYGYNALAVVLLAGTTRKHPKLIRALHQSQAVTIKLVPQEPGRSHDVLELAYNSLPAPLREFLSRFAAFRSPAEMAALKVIFEEAGVVASLKRSLRAAAQPLMREYLIDVRACVNELADRGLVLVDRDGERYDLHPIVRHYAYDRLADKRGVHTRLVNYFARIPVRNPADVRSLDDLASLIELYHHMLGSQRYEEGLALFVDRLAIPLLKKVHAFNAAIELLECHLADDDSDSASYLVNDENVAWLRTLLGACYQETGQFIRAERFFRRILDCDLAQVETSRNPLDAKGTVAVELIQLSRIQMLLGTLEAAEKNARKAIIYLDQVGTPYEHLVAHTILAGLLEATGRLEESRNEHNRAGAFLTSIDFTQMEEVGFSYADESAMIKAQRARETICTRFPNDGLSFILKRDPIAARGEALPKSREADQGAPLAEAERLLVEALTEFRMTNRIGMELEYLPLLSYLRLMQDDYQDALRLGKDALSIAKRCGHRLMEADLHNLMAKAWLRLAAATGVAERTEALREAKHHIEQAKERAWCEGPPYTYDMAMDEAGRLARNPLLE